jgi:hypothetical protein
MRFVNDGSRSVRHKSSWFDNAHHERMFAGPLWVRLQPNTLDRTPFD